MVLHGTIEEMNESTAKMHIEISGMEPPSFTCNDIQPLSDEVLRGKGKEIEEMTESTVKFHIEISGMESPSFTCNEFQLFPDKGSEFIEEMIEPIKKMLLELKIYSEPITTRSHFEVEGKEKEAAMEKKLRPLELVTITKTYGHYLGLPTLYYESNCRLLRAYGNITDCLIGKMSSKYLIRNNKDKFEIEGLRGKIVGLFFMSLTPEENHKEELRLCILNLATSYNELSKSKKGQFEIVLIASGDSSDSFDEYLEMMPWLAVPFIDRKARDILYRLAELEYLVDYDLLLFDCHGQLLIRSAHYLFDTYGAYWYPFTDEKLEELALEDIDIDENKSLMNLLANPTRDFVIANDGKHVPIDSLEDNVVGIYFCDANRLRSDFTQKLVELYMQLKQKGKGFEVVLVYDEYEGWWGEEFFMQEFKLLPWLALPYMDSNCRRMLRIFDPIYEEDSCLIIVGPRGSFVNTYGYSVVKCYGIEAYPFSRLTVAEMKKKRLEQVNLKSLLTCGDNDYVISPTGQEIAIADLCERTTIILLFTHFNIKNPLVADLIEWYNEMTLKEERADFEVIFVCSGYEENSFSGYHLDNPWVVLPYSDTRIDSLRSALNITDRLTLSVFGPEGRLLSMDAEFHFCQEKGLLGSFSDSDLLMDIYRVLARRHMWPEEVYDDKNVSPV